MVQLIVPDAMASCMDHCVIPQTVLSSHHVHTYRRQGVGGSVATRLFDGTWEVAVIQTNTPAQHCWRTLIAEYTSRRYEERSATSGTTDVVFRCSGGHGRENGEILHISVAQGISWYVGRAFPAFRWRTHTPTHDSRWSP